MLGPVGDDAINVRFWTFFPNVRSVHQRVFQNVLNFIWTIFQKSSFKKSSRSGPKIAELSKKVDPFWQFFENWGPLLALSLQMEMFYFLGHFRNSQNRRWGFNPVPTRWPSAPGSITGTPLMTSSRIITPSRPRWPIWASLTRNKSTVSDEGYDNGRQRDKQSWSRWKNRIFAPPGKGEYVIVYKWKWRFAFDEGKIFLRWR